MPPRSTLKRARTSVWRPGRTTASIVAGLIGYYYGGSSEGMTDGTPKAQKLVGPTKEVETAKQTTAQAKDELRKKRGMLSTALAGETTGGGYGGVTALS